MNKYDYAKLVKVKIPDEYGVSSSARHEFEAHELGTILEVDEYDNFISRSTYYRLSTGKFVEVGRRKWSDIHGDWQEEFTASLAYSQLPTALKIAIEKRQVLNVTKTKIEVDY